MSKTANIFNIQHFSVNDGPGIRTVVFFKGCPLDCVWCHNPESKSVEQELSFSNEKCILCKKCAEICPCSVHTFENNIHHIKRMILQKTMYFFQITMVLLFRAENLLCNLTHCMSF